MRAAVDLASVEGLEGLSIGHLAAELGMSKSGLFAHFGSKEELQLAAIDTALDIFVAEVIRPARMAKPGFTRLQALCDAWVSYVERKVFRGGCFFMAVAIEFDSRPGVVRDRVAGLMQQWEGLLRQILQQAQDLGEIRAEVDAAQLAFELITLMWGANALLQLHSDSRVAIQTRTAVAQRLQSIAHLPETVTTQNETARF